MSKHQFSKQRSGSGIVEIEGLFWRGGAEGCLVDTDDRVLCRIPYCNNVDLSNLVCKGVGLNTSTVNTFKHPFAPSKTDYPYRVFLSKPVEFVVRIILCVAIGILF